MSIIADITVPLVGQTHVLTTDDVSNFQDIMDHISTNQCNFTIIYNDTTYEGVVSKTVDEVNLLFVFDEAAIALPSGMCMLIDCLGNETPDEENHTHCYDNFINPVIGDERIIVADEDGCPIGYITVAGLLVHLAGALDIPTSLCDLLDVTEIPQGNLVAADRILTTQTGCTLKSVPQSDIDC